MQNKLKNMNFFYKSKKISKIGDSLRSRLAKNQIWRGIEASQVGEIYKNLSEELKELKGSRFISWKDNVIKVEVGSSVQRQEIILKQAKILGELNRKNIKAKEIRVVFK